jgi:hypothetical protein
MFDYLKDKYKGYDDGLEDMPEDQSESNAQNYTFRYYIFIDTKDDDAVCISYSNYDRIKKILKDLKAYKFKDESSWISYYQNVTGDRYATTA